MLDIFTSLPASIPLKWLFLLMPLLTLAVWHHYQNKMFDYLQTAPSARLYNELLSVARWRAWQVVIVWLGAILLIASADTKHYFDQNPEALPQREEETLSENDLSETEAGAEVPTREGLQPLDFSSIEQQSAARQVTEEQLDDLKLRFEDAFISYFYLQRCGEASVKELKFLTDLLADSLTKTGGDAALQHNILNAAQGSYEAVYADTPCEADYLDPVKRQFRVFITSKTE